MIMLKKISKKVWVNYALLACACVTLPKEGIAGRIKIPLPNPKFDSTPPTSGIRRISSEENSDVENIRAGDFKLARAPLQLDENTKADGGHPVIWGWGWAEAQMETSSESQPRLTVIFNTCEKVGSLLTVSGYLNGGKWACTCTALVPEEWKNFSLVKDRQELYCDIPDHPSQVRVLGREGVDSDEQEDSSTGTSAQPLPDTPETNASLSAWFTWLRDGIWAYPSENADPAPSVSVKALPEVPQTDATPTAWLK